MAIFSSSAKPGTYWRTFNNYRDTQSRHIYKFLRVENGLPVFIIYSRADQESEFIFSSWEQARLLHRCKKDGSWFEHNSPKQKASQKCNSLLWQAKGAERNLLRILSEVQENDPFIAKVCREDIMHSLGKLTFLIETKRLANYEAIDRALAKQDDLAKKSTP